MGFSAGRLGAERVTVGVPGCDERVGPIDVSQSAVVVGPEANEQLAIKRATQGASPAMRVGRALRERRPPWRVFSPFFAGGILIVGITAFTPGAEYRANERYQVNRPFQYPRGLADQVHRGSLPGVGSARLDRFKGVATRQDKLVARRRPLSLSCANACLLLWLR
ncbi:hypothetical protein ACQPYK_04320 [Streptosporangium sp. CA-135522]|uniref:hypothetical protein n=1 Tax=Streptosporangium sp. CA-135522 TaxID=3240072 RepID=UPI003D8F0EA4